MQNKILIKTGLYLFIASFFFSGCSPREAKLPPHPVRASLISEYLTASPGQIVSVGVLFEMDDPWHIYWKFPGEGGIPTSVELNLPFAADSAQLRWPVPQSFTQPGNMRGIGYKGSELLWYDIVVPEDYAESSLTFEAEAIWLACAEICIPGRKKLKRKVDVGQPEKGPEAPLFGEARKRLPRVIKLERLEEPLELESDPSGGPAFNIEPLDEEDHFDYRIVVSGLAVPEKLEIFAAGNYDLRQEREQTGDEARALYLWVKDAYESGKKEMEILFLYPGDSGDRNAVSLRFPGKEHTYEVHEVQLEASI